MPRLNRHVKIWSIVGSLIGLAVLATFAPAEGSNEAPSGEPVWAHPADVGPDSLSTSEDDVSLDGDGSTSLEGPGSPNAATPPRSPAPDGDPEDSSNPEDPRDPAEHECPEAESSGSLSIEVSIDIDVDVEGGAHA